VEWLVNALGGALVGLLIGGLIALLVRQLTSRPEELIVD
jgi:NhaP-type Na+/H+ or K+/H+ antiporter